MIKFCVTSASAVSEPRTTATAATNFPGFRDYAAFGTGGTDGRRRGCRCVYVGVGQNTKMETQKQSLLHGVDLGLTFAGLGALRPPVISVSVTDTSATLIPSTSKSATADSAGFRELAALWARHLIAGGDS